MTTPTTTATTTTTTTAAITATTATTLVATRTRQLSGFKPTGRMQLGNLLGAVRPLIAAQDRCESIAMIANMQALTLEHNPQRVREHTLEVARLLIAAGVDPQRTTLYIQSHLAEHAQLHYLLECATGFGEARRMIQFRERSAGPDPVRLSLLTYPVLMAADILLHDTDEVPVGEDQSQHLELTRDVAYRFNTRYGQTFTVPRGINPPVAKRVMDLADPKAKMGKSNEVTTGVIALLDPPEVVRRKVMRAVTDAKNLVRHDPQRQPGVANLLEIYSACTDQTPAFESYGALKEGVAEAIISVLEPLQRNYKALSESDVKAILREGAERARPRAAATLERATEAIGLLTAF